MLGLLTLDTAFPRIAGDVGAPETFDFPVMHEVVAGACVEDVVHRRRETLLPAFVDAGRRLVDAGCTGIATTCGFLVRWQKELTEALPVPVMTSALLQQLLVQRTLPAGRHAGIVTYSAADLGADALAVAGIDPYTPIEGIEPGSYFEQTIRLGRPTLDPARMREDTVAAARRLLRNHPHVAAIVLECANMPPYRDAVQDATGLPVYDAAQLCRWFHAGLARVPPHRTRRNLW
jgi:hypothetical protein